MKDPYSKLKNAVALAAGRVARKKIDLQLAERAFDIAQKALERAINNVPEDGTTLYLVSSGANKIGVIKAVREITSLGLKEAKDLVDAAGFGDDKLIGVFSDSKRMKHAVSLLEAAGATTKIV